jgi:predicted N-acetyltransferase YhbS
MIQFTLSTRPMAETDFETVEDMSAEAFGPGRFARAAFRLREGVAADLRLSFVATLETDVAASERRKIVGSVLVTQIRIGDQPGLLLGPLVVLPGHKNLGIGRELMNRAIGAARQARHKLMILVGDEPYYGRFGFRRIPPGQIFLPGPVDPARLLACELQRRALSHFRGAATGSVQKCNNLLESAAA